MEICPYCGTRNPVADNAPAPTPGNPHRCSECAGVLDDLSMTATQIAMGPWFFRQPKKPFGPGCDITILRKLLAAGRIKPDSPVRGPASHQLWRRVKDTPGIAHLAGVCHSCHATVKPDSKFCQDCGTRFETPEQRNEWGLPAEPVAQVVAAFRAADAQMCCVCGHDKTGPDVCPECDTIFSPADEATRITLGGWFVHGKAYAHKPGISHEQLKKEIELGAITGRTVVRGPTTEQFWQLAKNTPGVAHLTGSCHACGEKVESTAQACPACNASFSIPADPQWVGLRYPTAEAAAAAQKKLDAELAALEATMPPVPIKKKQPKDDEVYEDVAVVDTESEVEDESHDHVYGHSDFESAYDDGETELDAHRELVGAGAAADPGGFDLNVGGDTATGRERRVTDQYKKSQGNLIAVLVITPIVIIGAFLAISAMSGGDDDKDAAKDQAAQKDARPAPAVLANPQLTKLKNDTIARMDQFKLVERKGKAAPLLGQAQATLAKANELYDSEQFLDADAEYRKVEAPLMAVETLQQQRAQATETRGRAQAALNEAKTIAAPQHAKPQWDEAEASFALGAKLLDAEDFDQAIVAWTNAVEQYGTATRLVKVMLTAADVRAKIEADATRTFSREELDRENIPAWNAVKGKLVAGDDAVKARDYETAMQYYDQARLMVPSLDFAMKLQIGRNYWAYQTGRLTANIVKDKVAGNHPDQEMLAKLKQAYENLQINRDFFNRVPKDPKSSFKELAEVLIIECGKEIEASFEEGGAAARASFGLGLQIYQVEKNLRADIGKITPRTREELEICVKRLIPDNAKIAGYSPEFLRDVKDFEETLATEQNIPIKSREKWAAIVEKLENFDTAMKIVTTKK